MLIWSNSTRLSAHLPRLLRWPTGTAVGLMKGVVSVTLVLLANLLSKKAMDISVL